MALSKEEILLLEDMIADESISKEEKDMYKELLEENQSVKLTKTLPPKKLPNKKTTKSKKKTTGKTGKNSKHLLYMVKKNGTHKVWLGNELVADFATKERADVEAKRLNDIEKSRNLIKECKYILSQKLAICNEKRTPYLYKLKSTPEGYKKIEDFVLQVVFRGGNKVGFAIMEMERQLNPNYIID